MMSSYGAVSDDIKKNLEIQRENIAFQDKEAAKKEDEAPSTDVSKPVNTYQIEALSTMLDDYENIVTKNYCVYTNYEDFSFA